jgi:hypothetical protein
MGLAIFSRAFSVASRSYCCFRLAASMRMRSISLCTSSRSASVARAGSSELRLDSAARAAFAFAAICP